MGRCAFFVEGACVRLPACVSWRQGTAISIEYEASACFTFNTCVLLSHSGVQDAAWRANVRARRRGLGRHGPLDRPGRKGHPQGARGGSGFFPGPKHGDFSGLLCLRFPLHNATLVCLFVLTQELLIDRVRARGAMLDRLASYDARHPEAQDMHRDPKPTRWYQRKKTRALVAFAIWRGNAGARGCVSASRARACLRMAVHDGPFNIEMHRASNPPKLPHSTPSHRDLWRLPDEHLPPRAGKVGAPAGPGGSPEPGHHGTFPRRGGRVHAFLPAAPRVPR